MTPPEQDTSMQRIADDLQRARADASWRPPVTWDGTAPVHHNTPCMMIWKYPLSGHITALDIPAGGVILTLQMQGDLPTLWVQVDPQQPPVRRIMYLYATGEVLHNRPMIYLGTVQRKNGVEVLHLFEHLA